MSCAHRITIQCRSNGILFSALILSTVSRDGIERQSAHRRPHRSGVEFEDSPHGLPPPRSVQRHSKTVTAAPRGRDPFTIDVVDDLAPAHTFGDTVTIDGLSAHKVKAVREAIGAAGTRLLCRHGYSPDSDPIENALAKLKPCFGPRRLEPSPTCAPPSGKPRRASPLQTAATVSPPQPTEHRIRPDGQQLQRPKMME